MIAPDDTTFAYLEGRPQAPVGEVFAGAVEAWRALATDKGAAFDAVIQIDASKVTQSVTWGTSPEDVIAIDGRVPDPDREEDRSKAQQMRRALDYMGLLPGQSLVGLPIDVVFIGSCTNSRIEDLRQAAAIVRGRRVAPGVRAMIVPGSGNVKAEAEAESLDHVFRKAGFEWREAGCSMCVGMNSDQLMDGQRCASTSNRNFEHRQGPGGRTHLMSPAMAAAAAIAGALVDVSTFEMFD